MGKHTAAEKQRSKLRKHKAEILRNRDYKAGQRDSRTEKKTRRLYDMVVEVLPSSMVITDAKQIPKTPRDTRRRR